MLAKPGVKAFRTKRNASEASGVAGAAAQLRSLEITLEVGRVDKMMKKTTLRCSKYV